MKYICFENETSGVPRIFLEKLGVSTKRDNDATIGQFGSGSKLGVISAIRQGINWISCGFDEDGAYQLQYVISDEDKYGLQHVMFDYGDSQKESSYTVEAGLLSWNDPFQIFREAFSNCYDAFLEDGSEWNIFEANEVENRPGWFRTYLTATGDMLEINDNFDTYFLFNRTPIESNEYGEIYEATDGVMRVYHKGVLVWEDNCGSMFHYNINIALNEERKVADSYSIGSKIAKLLQFTKSPEVSKVVFENLVDQTWETTRVSIYSLLEGEENKNQFWVDEWQQRFGKAVAINGATIDASHSVSVAKNSGIPYQLVGVSGAQFVFHLLTTCGVPTLHDSLGEGANYNFVEPTLIEQRTFDKAREIAGQFMSLSEVIAWKFFDPLPKQAGVLGVAKDGEVYLSRTVLTSVESTLATIVHEVDHIVSGLRDSDNAFRTIADQRIAQLMMALA